MSLRIRLTGIVVLLFLLSTGIGALYIVLAAKDKVRDEVQSAATLTSELLGLIINTIPVDGDPDTATAVMDALKDLKGIRHLEIQTGTAEGTVFNNIDADIGTTNAPQWFVRLVKPATEETVFSIQPRNNRKLFIFTNPNDEIEEVWEETKTSLILAFSIAVLFAAALFFVIGRWLKPVRDIAAGLDAVEHGDYSQRLPAPALPELQLIADRFNHLSEVLADSKSENDRLKRLAIDIQEQERRHLAQELHDEMGQAISAIKAIAVTNARHNRDKDPISVGHAEGIEQIADRMYASVRGMIGRLRPLVFDELGLVAALQQMTDDWNEHHRDTFCSLKLAGFDRRGGARCSEAPLNEQQQIHVYRIVQEALTNAAKHAKAALVKVTVGVDVKRGSCEIHIVDDGAGYDIANTTKGIGLLGIEDRVGALNGTLRIHSAPGQGVTMRVGFLISAGGYPS